MFALRAADETRLMTNISGTIGSSLLDLSCVDDWALQAREPDFGGVCGAGQAPMVVRQQMNAIR